MDLEPQVFDLLVYLLQNRERVVSKDDLLASVWGGRIVSDATLDSRIAAARRVIGDSGGGQTLIRTWARKGVRFIGEVREEDVASAPSKSSPIPARRGLGAWIRTRVALALVALVCATVAITAVIVQWSRPAAPDRWRDGDRRYAVPKPG